LHHSTHTVVVLLAVVSSKSGIITKSGLLNLFLLAFAVLIVKELF